MSRMTIALLLEEVNVLKSRLAALENGQTQTRPASRVVVSNNSQLMKAKELAKEYKTTARIENGVIQLYSTKRGEWRNAE